MLTINVLEIGIKGNHLIELSLLVYTLVLLK
jgi:hypothetical protein